MRDIPDDAEQRTVEAAKYDAADGSYDEEFYSMLVEAAREQMPAPYELHGGVRRALLKFANKMAAQERLCQGEARVAYEQYTGILLGITLAGGEEWMRRLKEGKE